MLPGSRAGSAARADFSFVPQAVSFWKSNNQVLLVFPFADSDDAASGNAFLVLQLHFSFRMLYKDTFFLSVLSLAALCFQMSTGKLMEFSRVDKGAADTPCPSLTNDACFKKHHLPLPGNSKGIAEMNPYVVERRKKRKKKRRKKLKLQEGLCFCKQ